MKTLNRARAVVAALIVAERRRRKLKQGVIARRLKKPQSWVSRLESGERRICIPEFLTLARVIGFNPARAFSKLHRRTPARKRSGSAGRRRTA